MDFRPTVDQNISSDFKHSLEFVHLSDKITSLQSETQLFVSRLKSKHPDKNPKSTLKDLQKKIEKINGDLQSGKGDKLSSLDRTFLINWLEKIHQMVDYHSNPSAVKVNALVQLNALEQKLAKGNEKQIGDLFGTRRYKTWHSTHELQAMRKELQSIIEGVKDADLLKKAKGLAEPIDALLAERGIKETTTSVQASQDPNYDPKKSRGQNHYYPESLPKEIKDSLLTSYYQTNDMRGFMKFFLVAYPVHSLPEHSASALLQSLEKELSKEDLKAARKAKGAGHSDKQIVHEIFSKLWEPALSSYMASKAVADVYMTCGAFTIEHYKALKSTLNRIHLADAKGDKEVYSVESELSHIEAKASWEEKEIEAFTKSLKVLKQILRAEDFSFEVHHRACMALQRIYRHLKDPRMQKNGKADAVIKLVHKMDMFERVKQSPAYTYLKALAILENTLGELEKELLAVGLQKASKKDSLNDLIRLNNEMRMNILSCWPVLANLPETGHPELSEKVKQLKQRLQELGFLT